MAKSPRLQGGSLANSSRISSPHSTALPEACQGEGNISKGSFQVPELRLPSSDITLVYCNAGGRQCARLLTKMPCHLHHLC